MPYTIADLRKAIVEGELYYDGASYNNFHVIDVSILGQSRWVQGVRVTIKAPDGKLFGYEYDQGLTEMQEDEFPWDYGYEDRFEVYEMVESTETRTVYKPQGVVTDA